MLSLVEAFLISPSKPVNSFDMRYKNSKLKIFVATLFTLFLFGASAVQAADKAKGEALFKQHCTACHKVNAKLVGPALKGVTTKYKGEEEWLYAWIKNNQALIKAGDPKAVALYEANGKAQMNSFTFFEKADIDNILEYVETYVEVDPTPTPGASDGGNQDAFSNPTIYYSVLGLAGALVALALFLVLGAAGLSASVRAKDESKTLTSKDVWSEFGSFLRNKFVLTSIIIIAVSGGTLKLIQAARGVSLHEGYMPAQPIKFSHKLHAGQQEINCQYCHSGASKSKNAWVPSTNVCMNCHKAVEAGPTYGKAEIAKIYMSAGWNPDAKNYFAEGTSVDTVAAAFKKWMTGDKKIKNINQAYTDANAIGFKKAIEWVRVHNLPDHAYFNHAQHIAVGGKDKDGKTIECQTCHGPVQEMEVLYQHSPLSMGWCINCHRQSKTNYSFPDPTDPKKTINPSPADMGGLDCARCHY